MNLDLLVYRLLFYKRVKWFKKFMNKLNHLLNPKTLKYISAINL